MFMFLEFRAQHINVWPLAHRSGDPPPPPGQSPEQKSLCLCAFSFPANYSRSFGFRKSWCCRGSKPISCIGCSCTLVTGVSSTGHELEHEISPHTEHNRKLSENWQKVWESLQTIPCKINKKYSPINVDYDNHLQVCLPGRGRGPETGKKSSKHWFWPHPENKEKAPKNRKMAQRSVFRPFSRIWGGFFPIFRVRPRSDSLRAQRLKKFNLAWKFQSRLKISILTFGIPHKK